MFARRLALCGLMALAGTSAIYAPSTSARTFVSVGIRFAPPAPLVENVAVVRPGHVWIPGYWRWNGYRYGWVGGYWGPSRIGYYYSPSVWVRGGLGWRFHAGYWRH